MKNEFEAKFLNIDVLNIRAKLEGVGATLIHSSRLMKRQTFHPKIDADKLWGRVRDEGDKITLTIKKIEDSSNIKGTFEAEVIVDSFTNAGKILEAVGFSLTSYQENKRERWQYQSVEITIDEWPGLKPFLEIEAPSEDVVENFVKTLGYDMNQAVFGSVSNIYQMLNVISEKEFNKLKEVTFLHPPIVK